MDNSSSSDSAAAAGLIAGGMIVYFLIIAVMIAVFIWVYWRIFQKAGYSGALALLNLVPGFGPLICVLILAFGRWPIEDQLAALRAGGVAPAPAYIPPPSAPPPSSTLST
jgi:hypothetical protein